MIKEFNKNIFYKILLVDHNPDTCKIINEFFYNSKVLNQLESVKDGLGAIDNLKNDLNTGYKMPELILINLYANYCRELFEKLSYNSNLINEVV